MCFLRLEQYLYRKVSESENISCFLYLITLCLPPSFLLGINKINHRLELRVGSLELNKNHYRKSNVGRVCGKDLHHSPKRRSKITRETKCKGQYINNRQNNYNEHLLHALINVLYLSNRINTITILLRTVILLLYIFFR